MMFGIMKTGKSYKRQISLTRKLLPLMNHFWLYFISIPAKGLLWLNFHCYSFFFYQLELSLRKLKLF